MYGASAGGISAGLVDNEATVSGSVRAKLSGNVTGSAFITIIALATMHADADSTFFGIGGLAIAGTVTNATISADTIAGGDGGNAATSGALTVTGTSTYTADATSDGVTVGLGTVNVKIRRPT